MGNFPEKWGPSGTVALLVTLTVAKQATGRMQAPAGHPPSLPTHFPLQPPLITQSGGMADVRPVAIRQTDIHPKIKALMTAYIAHFRSVQFRLLCKAADVTENDLPTIPRYVIDGKNGMCYSYLLGKCQGKVCRHAPSGHVAASEISDAFATALCTKLAPGVEQRLATEPPNTAMQLTSAQGGKRHKWAN